ncbi:MAG: GW dipeptide domain-containing protein [Bacteroidetes bacterium]|nr:GW dipeptide domain-containing protein [Bacteroidota bacterium]
MKALKTLVLYSILILIAASCNMGSKKVKNLAPNAHQVVAEEVIPTSNYTYVRVTEDDNEYWLATEMMDVKKGGTYFWSLGGEMTNFKSRELNRTFPKIMFIGDFTDKPITTDMKSGVQKPTLQSMAGKQMAPQKEGIKVDKAPGGITIAELYAKSSSYAGKPVEIRGEVVKFATDIMHINWAHIQDGTRDGDKYDLAVTTRDTVKVGDVVIFEGTISVNKDFGAGYKYEVIMEAAKKK